MRQYALLFIAAALILACNSNETQSTTSANVDSPLQMAPTPPDPSMLKNALEVSPDEMRDDSVFTDGSIPTSWENAGISDVKGLKLFLKRAQQWVMNNDKEQLAAVVRYPLKDIKSGTELISQYDRVFTKDVKLSFATINFSQLFRNQNGVMLGGGKVWITQSGKEFLIYAINQ